MANEKIVLAQLELDVSGLLKSAKEAKDALAKITEELTDLVFAGDITSLAFRSMKEDAEKLTKSLDAQIDALKEQIKKNEKLAESQKSVKKAIEKTADAQESLTEEYLEAADAISGLSAASEDAKQKLAAVNAAMAQQQALAAQAVTATTQQVKTFNDYKQQLADSAQSINIFNGGLGGFISRAQEAGGVGPLVSGAFNGMAEGIGGMTKSALAFMATPLGAAIAAISAILSPVISYFKDTQEGIDMVTSVTRPLQAVFSALVGVFQNVGKNIVGVFTSPLESIEKFGSLIKDNIVNRFTGLMELIPNIGKAIGLLFEGEFAQAGKVAADAVGKVALGTDNITGKVMGAGEEMGKFLSDAYANGKRIDELQKKLDKSLADYTKRNSELKTELEGHNKIADDTNRSFSEREAAAVKAIEATKEQNKLMVERLDQEIELLKLKLSQNGLTDAENAEIAEMIAKRNEAAAQGAAAEKTQVDKVKAIRSEQHAHEAQLRQKKLEDTINKHKQELDLFIAKGSTTAKTQQEQIKFEQEVSAKRLQIFKEELAAKKISRAEYDTKVINETNALAKKVTEVQLAHSRVAMEMTIQESKSKLDSEKKLTSELIAEENARLAHIKNIKMQQLAAEKGVNAQIIADKIATNQQLTIEEMQFRTADLAAQQELEGKQKQNNEALKTQEEQQAAEAQATKKMVAVASAETEYQEKLALEDIRHQEEMARLNKMLEDGQLTKEQYEVMERKEAEETSKIKTKLAIENAQKQLGGMQSVANALGEAFGQSKELAIAQATMSGAQAILSIWSGQITGYPIIDAIIKGALSATTAVTTAKQIQSIKSAKKPKQPKFAKGGLLSIGGKRHSAGGTMFTGADGTQFEAEQGELIGVMNRNAARHFMAFNNAFPAGGTSAPNYFAGGGIVSREIASPGINADELAVKIAEANRSLPAPVVAVQDIITEGNSYVQVRDGANF